MKTIELRFWIPDQARKRWEALNRKGISANLSSDGRGVIVRCEL